MYRIMCDRIWEKKMKFGCCKQLWAVVNWKLSERFWGEGETRNRGFAVGPHPCWETCFCFSARTRGTRCFLEAYTRHSLWDELSSASVNSSRSVNFSRCYFDLFRSAACASAATRLLKCSFRFQEVLIAHSMQKKKHKNDNYFYS